MAPGRQKVDLGKVANALTAMKDIGIPKHTTKPVLKNLLKVYENNWELIEADNYQVLADAIFDMQEDPNKKIYDDDEGNKGKEAASNRSSELESKKSRVRREEQCSPSSMLISEVTMHTSPSMHEEEPQFSPRMECQHVRMEADNNQAISDVQDAGNKRKEPVSDASPEPYRKKLRARQNEGQHTSSSVAASSNATFPRTPKIEPDSSPQMGDQLVRKESILPHGDPKDKRIETASLQPIPGERVDVVTSPQTPKMTPTRLSGRTDRVGPVSPPRTYMTRASTLAVQRGSVQEKANCGPLLTNQKDKQPIRDMPNNASLYKEPIIESGVEASQRKGNVHCFSASIRPKDEPTDSDSPGFEVPIAMICPPHPIPAVNGAGQDGPNQISSTIGRGSTLQENLEATSSRHRHMTNGVDESSKKATDSELVNVQDSSSSNVEIASSAAGEVKVSLTCNIDRPDFHMPTLETILKMVEDKCLNSYKILNPSFSLMNVMKEICQSVVELGSESSADRQEDIINVVPLLDPLKKSNVTNILGGPSLCSSKDTLNLVVPQGSEPMVMTGVGRSKQKEMRNPETSNTNSQNTAQKQLVLSKPLHDVNDISKGEERVRVSLVNEINSQKYPPSFFYIPQNIVYQNAYLNFSLARIGDEDCCADCFGDCLTAPVPCACARESGGEYAYDADGLVKKKFLDECISTNDEHNKDRLFYCKACPLERSKKGHTPDSCKGHLVRKFIKECWSKCGCNKQCGNRVVQRGITCNLQVFYTSEGKGWGLRTLDELPRGAFVCEYVGEVLTNLELYDRTIKTRGNAKHTYPVLLDADWGSEGVLKDEEALCLDATFYGNVARFVNHRCVDANMIEIPVEVETPDHHYYHLAFFTTRNVEAFEELTWDYGIDFDDHAHPVKAFQCRCKSKFCRDLKRTRRRSGTVALK